MVLSYSKTRLSCPRFPKMVAFPFSDADTGGTELLAKSSNFNPETPRVNAACDLLRNICAVVYIKRCGSDRWMKHYLSSMVLYVMEHIHAHYTLNKDSQLFMSQQYTRDYYLIIIMHACDSLSDQLYEYFSMFDLTVWKNLTVIQPVCWINIAHTVYTTQLPLLHTRSFRWYSHSYSKSDKQNGGALKSRV